MFLFPSYPTIRSIGGILTLLFLYVCMYGYGFLSRGFTDPYEI